MNGVEAPIDFIHAMKEDGLTFQQIVVEPPAGISRNDCVPAHCARTNDWEDDGMGSAFMMFFEPSDEERDRLINGGHIKLTLRGRGLVPHAISVW